MVIDLLSRFVVSLAIGGLVGLEREIYQQRSRRGFAGIRTYILVAFLGALSSYLLQNDTWRILAYILMTGVIAFLVVAYYVSAIKGYIGMTTELSVVVVYLLAILASFDDYQKLAVILGVVLAVILSLKENLHNLARATKKIEWYDALTFVFMAFVILPLLPNKDLDVLGIAGAFNPYRTWLMIVFASGVSFIGYFLTKVIGGAYGIGLAGMLGGVVSSTAVTESMASDSKKNPTLVNSYAFGAIAASVVMGLRVLFEVWVVDSRMLSMSTIPLLLMTGVGVILAVQWISKNELQKRKIEVKLGSPLSLNPALMFGILYSVVVFVSHSLTAMNMNSYGFMILGVLAGLVNVDAITLSMTGLFSQGGVSEVVAWSTVIIAVTSNTFFKMLSAYIFGSRQFFKRVGISLLLVAITGILALIVYLI